MLKTLLLLYFFTMPQGQGDIGFSDKFKPAVQKGIISDMELSEVSGMVASRNNKGHFWVVNDSGNWPLIYLIDQSGKIVHSAFLAKSLNIDWEDMAISTNPKTGEPQLIVADIGDNGGIRDHINILIFDEPDWTNHKEDTIHDVVSIKLKYEDGPRDAETLLADPISNKVYIITKREEQVRMYEIPGSSKTTDSGAMIFKGTLPYHNITSGDISADGREIVLKSYNAIYYWERIGRQDLLDVLSSKHELLHYKPEPQGESIGWTIDGSGFYTLSEKSWAARQVLFFYERKSTK